MTLKAKLTASLAAIIVLASAVLGFVSVRTVERSLMNQVDARLLDVATRPAFPSPPKPEPEPASTEPGRPEPASTEPGRTEAVLPDEELTYRRYAELVFQVDGTPLLTRPSGFADAPDPLPVTDPSEVLDRLGSPMTVDGADGSAASFRVLAVRTPSGDIRLIGQLLADEQATIRQATRLALSSGAIVVLGAALLSWFVIRRELKAVDRMIDTAGAIADGDMTQRIDLHQQGTELGKLAGSLNDMMGQLESAFAARAAGEERVRRFAADASHELRTPLTTVRGYAELYRNGGIPDGPPLDSAFARIESESVRMTRLVEDLLLLARLDQQSPLDVGPVDLGPLLTDTAADLRIMDPDRSITVAVIEPVTVLGDDRRLRQIVANLVSNAVQHTPSGTAVHLALRAEGTDAVIDVADDGPGIDPAIAERVFDRFYRAEKSRPAGSDGGRGSGLGLSIVAGLVTAHHGRVELIAPDESGHSGATFRVTLPLVDDQGAPAGISQPTPGS